MTCVDQMLRIVTSGFFGSEPDSKLAAAGDMPRGKQFGYLFMDNIASHELPRLVAHELGHGIFTLSHSFDVNYSGDRNKQLTSNLMDYANGTELAAFQWNVMANPAPLTWFDDEEDGMAIVFDSQMNKVFVENFRKTCDLLLNNNTGNIFNQVYASVSHSPQIFLVDVYKDEDREYIDNRTGGYFRAGTDITVEESWLHKIIADVFGQESTPKVIEAGSERAPHLIRFLPPDKSGEKNIETTTKSPTTVFEELFHAAQYLYYSEKQSSVLKEAEVKIARGYVMYINGGYSGNRFAEWRREDGWGERLLKNDTYKGIIAYFEAIKNNKSITEEIREAYHKDVVEYAKTHIVPVYKGRHNWSESEINSFNGKTPYLKHLIEK